MNIRPGGAVLFHADRWTDRGSCAVPCGQTDGQGELCCSMRTDGRTGGAVLFHADRRTGGAVLFHADRRTDGQA